VGPTASGKTALALELAERAGAEILSLDSMLVYRGLDVGTAKPGAAERARVPHHLIDLVEPSETYDVQRYLADARAALADVHGRGREALFVGGTGFYLAALLRGLFEGPPVDRAVRAELEQHARAVGPEAMHAELAEVDPRAAARLHPHDGRRVVRAIEVWRQTGRTLSDWQREWSRAPGARERRARLVGLALETDALDARIRARAERMLDGGWREEARAIRAGPGFAAGARQALGYDAVLDWADGRCTRAEAEQRIALRTRRFARRQRTWYRKFAITWIPAEAPDRGAAAWRALFGAGP
jgi:tRNA dimethylallyltransferase